MNTRKRRGKQINGINVNVDRVGGSLQVAEAPAA